MIGFGWNYPPISHFLQHASVLYSMMVILNRTISPFGAKTKYILVKPSGLRKSPTVHMRLIHS